MSVKNEFIKVTPPAYIGTGNMKETLASDGHPCDYCCGEGFFREEEHGEPVKTDCPVCRGSGKLDAAITIEWKPSKKSSK